MSRKREPVTERILRTIKVEGSCWIWQGSKLGDGYGCITIGRKTYRVHRVSYEAFKGPATGQLVCHSCDTPLCVNPSHLFLGSPAKNTEDMMKKGRHRPMLDAAHPNTKVPHAERETIRRLRADGATLKAIADKYGVCFQTISDICRGKGSYAARQ